MCGRFTLTRATDEVAQRFGADAGQFRLPLQYNIAPTQIVAAVRQNGTRMLEAFQWGLIPFWARDPQIGSRLINARAETLAEKPAFKHALTRRRCLIPSDGFYEWKKEGRSRQPFYIRRRDGALFAFAGLWETWESPEGEVRRTCVIITVEPNALLAGIHNRMPAILTPENESVWLDPGEKSLARLLSCLTPYPAEEMEYYPVSRLVNSPANDSPECLRPLDADEPSLFS
jgi:putative SOS response-associated peptidase YedK